MHVVSLIVKLSCIDSEADSEAFMLRNGCLTSMSEAYEGCKYWGGGALVHDRGS